MKPSLNETHSKVIEEQCLAKLEGHPNKSNHNFFCLKTLEGHYLTRQGERIESSVYWMKWGIMSNGFCATAKITSDIKKENNLALSDILEEHVDEKYFVSDEFLKNLSLEKVNAISTSKTGKITELGKMKQHRHSSAANSILAINGLCTTLDTMQGGGREPKILIPI